jgi:hypothetical protein
VLSSGGVGSAAGATLGNQIEFTIIFLLKRDETTMVDIVANDGTVALLFNCLVPLDLPALPGFSVGCSKGGER